MTEYRDFHEALPVGHDGETRIATALLAAGSQVQHMGDGSAFDLTATVYFGHPERIEVKNEDAKQDTGNICIEMMQGVPPEPKRYSGLSISESTVFIHTLGPRLVAYRTQPMRLFLRSVFAGEKMQDFGDHGNQGYVKPIACFQGNWWFDVTDDKHLARSHIFSRGWGAHG